MLFRSLPGYGRKRAPSDSITFFSLFVFLFLHNLCVFVYFQFFFYIKIKKKIEKLEKLKKIQKQCVFCVHWYLCTFDGH